MTEIDRPSLAPVIWDHNRSFVDQILQCVEDGIYGALLGPRFCGKTAILRHVQQSLQDDSLPCIYIDLSDTLAPTQAGFFSNLVVAVAQGVLKYTDRSLSQPIEELSSAIFRDFLSGCVDHLATNLTVIFDHLENLPTDLNQALLTSLRALHMEQQDKELRFVAIVSGALSLAALTIGETSPFHGIARRFILGDLKEEESKQLVRAHSASADIEVSPAARSLLLKSAHGNPHLIKYICKRTLATAAENPSRQVGTHTVRRVVREFLRSEAPHYGPLQEATRLIEDNPDLLQCILRLLKNETVLLRDLPLPLLPDLDPLYLTGMVEKVGGDRYRIRNEIYRLYLGEHFDAARTGHLLTVSGRWDAAIGQFESSMVAGNEESQADLLAATINSMYASETEEQAAFYLIRGLSAAFRVEQIFIWLLSKGGQTLTLVDQKGKTVGGMLPVDIQELPTDADKIEARSYRQVCILRESLEDGCIKYVIPLIVPGQPPMGVATLCDPSGQDFLTEHRKREFQLQSFLNQAARALYEVEFRRKRETRASEQDARLEKQTHQLFLLHRISTLSQTVSDLEKISHLILTAITAHFGLGFNRAWLFLMDWQTNCLIGRLGIGSFTEEQAYQAWGRSAPLSFDDYVTRLFTNKLEPDELDQPTRQLKIPISESNHDLFSMAVYHHHTFQWSGSPGHWHALPLEFRQLFEPGEMILTPLVINNNCLGLIAVDNKFRPRPYTETDELLLKTFANQMATTIFNLQLRDQEKRRLRLEETLRDTSLIIGSSLNLKEVLYRILEEMRKVLPFDTASIQLVNEETHSLKIIASTGFNDPQRVEALNFPLAEDYPNVLVYQKKEPLHFENAQKQFWHFADPHYQGTHIHGWLGAPLIVNDRAIGVITLDSKTIGIYTSEHDRMAVLFAGQASVAIENARLYEKERETKEYLDLLIGSSQDGIIAVDNHGWVIRYSEGAQKILGYSADEVRLKRVDELYGSMNVAREINSMLMASDRVRDYPTNILDRDNNAIPVVLSASLLRDKAGNPLGSVGFFKDLRPLRKVENNLRAILDTVSIMSKVEHSEVGLSALAERIVTVQPVTFCNILLLDESRENLIVKAAYPNPRPRSEGIRWKSTIGERISLGQAALMRRFLDLAESHVFQEGQVIEGINVVQYLQKLVLLEEEIRSVLIIPLKAAGEVFGICILGETRSWDRSPFDADKVELASSMVTQGTVFVDRLQAHEATQNKLVMVERLRSIGEDLVTASRGAEKSILQKVVLAACDVMGASSAVIYPWDTQLRTYDTDKIIYFGLRHEKSFSDKIRNEEGSMTGVVIRKGMVIVDDIQNGLDRSGETRIWAHQGKFLKTQEVQAFVGVSLRRGEEALGVLFVNFAEPHYFNDSELEAVNLFANQAVIAIENARLYEDLALRLDESTTLQKLGTLLAETRDLNLVLNRVMQAALELIHADSGNILFYEKSRDEFLEDALISAGLGSPLQLYKTRVRQGSGYSYQIIKSSKPVRISDTERDLNVNPVTLEKGRKAVLGVPLIGRENPVGILWVNWKTPRRISDRDERLLMALASQAAVSIENVRLFDELKAENARRNDESQALQEVGISLTAPIKLEEVLDRVLQAALELMHGDEDSILLYDESRDEFNPQGLMCKGPDQPIEPYITRLRQRSGLAYQIVRERTPIFIPDTAVDPRVSPVAIEKGRRAMVGVPLLDHDGPVGVLWVNWKEPRQVSLRDANLLIALASQATVAIKGARRYAELQRRSAHLEAVHEAGKVIAAASVGLDKQQVLDQILEQAIECVTGVSGSKASVGTIQLLEDETNELIVKSVFPQQYSRQSIDKFDHIFLGKGKNHSGKIGVTGRAVLTRQPQLVPDVNEDEDYIVHNEDTKSELAIPMMDNGKVIGVMDVESNSLNAFDELDKDSLGLLVDLAVVALRNTERAEQLARSNAVALMGAWGAEIAHDVNREVGNIRREAFLLQEREDLPPEVKKRLTAIDQYAEHLAQPDLSTKEPNAESWVPWQVSCNLIHVIQMALNKYQDSHPTISWQFQPEAPDIQVAIHQRRLLSIFRHLFRNAAHAISQAEYEGTVYIQTSVEEPMAIIEVEDTGPGVPPEIVATLFRKVITYPDGRMGSGLLLIQFIAEQYGGKVELVEPRRGRGACFRVWLPIVAKRLSM